MLIEETEQQVILYHLADVFDRLADVYDAMTEEQIPKDSQLAIAVKVLESSVSDSAQTISKITTGRLP